MAIPPKGSIPPAVRNNIRVSSGFSMGTCQQGKGQKSDFKVRKGLRGKSEEKVSPKGFMDKLSWLKDHLKELKEVKASTEKIKDIAKQINQLESLVGNLFNRKG